MLHSCVHARPDRWRCVAGTLPIEECVQTLHRHGYEGYLAFEWEKKWAPEIPEPEEAFPRYATEMQSILAKL